MNHEINNTDINIKKSTFKQFFKKELLSKLKDLEIERKRSIRNIILSIILFFVLASIAIYSFIILGKVPPRPISDIILIIVILPLLIGLSIHSDYRKKAKKIVMQKILSFIGDLQVLEGGNDEEYIRRLDLFDRYNNFVCDDYLTGTYNSLPINIQEISLVLTKGSGRSKRSSTIFRGLLIVVPCYKEFEESTIIKKKFFHIDRPIKLFENTPKITLEDPVFNKYYNVYSYDPVEARYLITTAFMQRMIQLSRHNKSENISVSFEYGNVNIAVDSDKDWFEFTIRKPATDIKQYKKFLYEILNILKIIDSLKLDQDIGL